MITKFDPFDNPVTEKEVEDEVMKCAYTSLDRDSFLKNFKDNIVLEIHPDIKFGWIMPNGQVIGYIGELDGSTCYHLALAAILCCYLGDWKTAKYNSYQYLEEKGGLKICQEYAITTNTLYDIEHSRFHTRYTLSPIQEKLFIEWLTKSKLPYIALGNNKQNIFTTYNIKQMDSLMLFNHLIS